MSFFPSLTQFQGFKFLTVVSVIIYTGEFCTAMPKALLSW
jgi:hypothetical protein